MVKLSEIEQFMCEIHPLKIAESWDNVGLLIGRRNRTVQNVMTCLTVTADVVSEAIDRNVQIIITHHPFPFKPASRFTDGQTDGLLFLELVENKIAVFSSHTAYDSAADGINFLTLQGLGLVNINPLIPKEDPTLGTGRVGNCDWSWEDGLKTLKTFYNSADFKTVKCGDRIRKVAVVCGSGGEFIATAKSRGVDLFITGEASFHQCILARHLGVSLVLTGHFTSERFAMEILAEKLQLRFSALNIFASSVERDPLQ